METTITVDKAGRMVLPKKVRDGLGLEAGDSLDLLFDGSEVRLRPSKAGVRIRKDRGIWVFCGGGAPIQAAETDRVLDEVRAGARGE